MCEEQEVDTLMTEAVPQVSCQQTEALVWQYYGLQGTVTLLTGERDHNFYVTAHSGRRYMLKVINAAEPVVDINGVALRMRLVSYLEGTPLHAIAPATALMQDMGETLAQLDLALGSFRTRQKNANCCGTAAVRSRSAPISMRSRMWTNVRRSVRFCTGLITMLRRS